MNCGWPAAAAAATNPTCNKRTAVGLLLPLLPLPLRPASSSSRSSSSRVTHSPCGRIPSECRAGSE
eukprot:351978-Chlamydomonas_euryale.AAC.6